MSIQDSAKWHRYVRFWRTNVSADVDDEIAFHVDARAKELVDFARRQGYRLDELVHIIEDVS
jgi:hypothetical protein